MDWAQLIKKKSEISAVLRVDELSHEFSLSETVVRDALRRQERRGLVEHVGKKIYVNQLAPDFSARELINLLRPDAYLSLQSVLRECGVSTQTPRSLTCVTTQKPAEFQSLSIGLTFRHITKKLFWGFQTKRTRYGTYNIAEPEKALLDWIYLLRQEGSSVPTDELNLHSLDKDKLIHYAEKYPLPVKRQIFEALAKWNSGAMSGPARA